MPHTIKNTDGGIGNVIESQGIITDRDYIDFYTAHLTQDRQTFSKYIYSLIDYTNVTDTDVNSESIKSIAHLCTQASQINPNPVVAFAVNNDLIYGLSRMYEALVSLTDWDIMVFRSKAEAMEWIRIRVNEKFGIDQLTFS